MQCVYAAADVFAAASALPVRGVCGLVSRVRAAGRCMRPTHGAARAVAALGSAGHDIVPWRVPLFLCGAAKSTHGTATALAQRSVQPRCRAPVVFSPRCARWYVSRCVVGCALRLGRWAACRPTARVSATTPPPRHRAHGVRRSRRPPGAHTTHMHSFIATTHHAGRARRSSFTEGCLSWPDERAAQCKVREHGGRRRTGAGAPLHGSDAAPRFRRPPTRVRHRHTLL